MECLLWVTGRELINAKPKPDRRKLNECKVVDREFVVAGCNTATVLDLIEEPLDQISGPIKIRAETERLFPIASRRDIRPGSDDDAQPTSNAVHTP
jgi:hypothetical protein